MPHHLRKIIYVRNLDHLLWYLYKLDQLFSKSCDFFTGPEVWWNDINGSTDSAFLSTQNLRNNPIAMTDGNDTHDKISVHQLLFTYIMSFIRRLDSKLRLSMPCKMEKQSWWPFDIICSEYDRHAMKNETLSSVSGRSNWIVYRISWSDWYGVSAPIEEYHLCCRVRDHEDTSGVTSDALNRPCLACSLRQMQFLAIVRHATQIFTRQFLWHW